MAVNAVRTLPDGVWCESRTSNGHGWFGLVDQPASVRTLPAGEGVTLTVDDAGVVVAVSSDRGKVTDSVLFHVLRLARFEDGQ